MRLRTEDLSWQRIDDEIVVLDLRGSSYLRLNNSGALLWERLVEGSDRASLVRLLVDRFGIAEGDAASDVDAFLADLKRAEFLDSAD